MPADDDRTPPGGGHPPDGSAPMQYVSDDGRYRLQVGDCLHWLADVADDSVDLVVTSPPYNIGVHYRSYGDRRDARDYLAWMAQVFAELARVLTPDGSFFLNVGATSINPWLAFDVASQARDIFVLQNRIVWAKSVAIGEATFGHFKPINSARFLNNVFEDVFHFTASGTVAVERRAIGVPFIDKANIARFGHSADRRCKGNIWHLPYATVQSKAQRFDHPAVFPESLVDHAIRLCGAGESSLLLDPFVGVGTSLVAAADAGIRACGIEVDPGYAATAWARLGTRLRRSR